MPESRRYPVRVIPRRALVRPPSDAYARCLRGESCRAIDPAAAGRQHEAYRRALVECGLEVIALPPEPDLPDACFVEDAAVVVSGRAVITRPGAPSRREETGSVARALARWLECVPLSAGRLDGGDVLSTDGPVLVGLSSRTDEEGARALAAALPDFEIRRVRVGEGLHLKSRMTPIGPRTILVHGPRPEVPDLEFIEAPEPLGGNVLWIGHHVIVSAAAPRTADLLRGRGLDVHFVELEEFHAGDAGITCLSVLF